MPLKRWLPLLGALGLMVMVVGVAGATNNKKSKPRTVTRACFWVETKGDRATYHDVKISRLNRSKVRFCIVGKSGAKGEVGATGAVGAAGAVGAQGIQGEIGPIGQAGAQGAQGEIGPVGPAGPEGETGAQGEEGPAGPAGAIGPVGPAGPAGPEGPAGPKGADGQAGPAGPAGPKGERGEQGPAGLDGSGIITVAGGTASGSKQFTVSCPANHVALSGGFSIQGSVTASFRSNAAGKPAGNTSWTIIQSSGANLSGTVYVYCVPSN